MVLTLTGRIASKKNSKRVFRNRYSGKTVVTSSKAFTTWHEGALLQIMASTRPTKPLEGDLRIDIYFYLKGRIQADIDNMTASLLDLLADAGIIENDDQVIEAHLYKRRGAPEFSTTLEVTQL